MGPVTTSASKGTPIAMTAPVMTSNTSSNEKVMQFYLPSEYDSLSKIPKPISPNVRILEVPPALGVTHTFNGWANGTKADSKVKDLVGQLNQDGLEIKETDALKAIFCGNSTRHSQFLPCDGMKFGFP